MKFFSSLRFSQSVSRLALSGVLMSASVNLYALDQTEKDYHLKLLGKAVFFDEGISVPSGMGCVTCHDPNTGWTGRDSDVNLHQVAITGANPHTVGSIKPPAASYASFVPEWSWENCGMGGLRLTNENGDSVQYCGGNFWNGRATGKSVDPLTTDSTHADYGSTKHIGDEIFYSTDGTLILDEETRNAYAAYFGPTTDQALNPMPNRLNKISQEKKFVYL